MAQLIVRNLEDVVKNKLRELAESHGWSMEEEVRRILRRAVQDSHEAEVGGLGTRLMERFRDCASDDVEISELRGEPPQRAELEP
ncbi:MAG: hypothetical protein AAF726_15950 [Planctomycetota bacterium]